MTLYFRPLPCGAESPGPESFPLAGGWRRFAWVEVLERGPSGARRRVEALPASLARRRHPEFAPVFARLTAPRAALSGLKLDRPRLMGVLNLTPDSFSDGGEHEAPAAAQARMARMIVEGAEILDLGAESTRPGAAPVSPEAEWDRLAPVLPGPDSPPPALLSVDTRNAAVAALALEAGARIFNDVSALTHDPESLTTAAAYAAAGGAVCLMHARGEPQRMQSDPRYDDPLLDVYDHLAERVAACEAAGIRRESLIVDPGIGFGKTLEHNLVLLRGLSLLHGLGCPVLLGVSRKSFIGALGGETAPKARVPGSLAAALHGASQGAQILRVHDVAQTRQALKVQAALEG
ncbi:dihydropteroate synthase [Neomegalonema sp.]|uniref:dihydropteroate synthase n=1 Tax=Neomegalonema sp. TaxID=2039713 RepID=UPI0026174962|nr:dihydropteroate synthase [Neomegalonema sp.]MDD2868902.1 dihydropteroate synthase [Neomegalonema sp.]